VCLVEISVNFTLIASSLTGVDATRSLIFLAMYIVGHECHKPEARCRHRFRSCGWAGLCQKRSLLLSPQHPAPLLTTQNESRGYQVLNQTGGTIKSFPMVRGGHARFMNSQVAQEVQYILLVGCTQHVELRNHLVGFRAAAGMLLDGG
jgi:hypothetical protein